MDRNHGWGEQAAPAPGLIVLILIVNGGFLGGYDFTALTIAIPSLTGAFQTSLSLASWVLLAYALVFAGFALPAANLLAVFGLKRVLALAYGTFALAALLAGLAEGLLWLCLLRGLQALGAAVFFRRRFGDGAAFGAGGLACASLSLRAIAPTLGMAFGSALGGLVTAGWGWPWILFLNLPFCLLVWS